MPYGKGAVRNFCGGGIGVSKMYATAMHRIPGICPYLANGDKQFPNADLVASCILTVPTHPMVMEKDLDLIVEVTNRCTHWPFR